MDIPLDFLEVGRNYEACIYSDDENADTPTQVNIEKRNLVRGDQISEMLKPQNGLAVYVKAL